ncbi:MAG: proline racemase family protein [Pseudomonadota bacterium]
MKSKQHIFAVDSHTMGEPTRVVISGIIHILGSTMNEKREYLESNFDHIRTALMHEPRGHNDMFGAIILEPTDPRADFGIVFMDSSGYLNMCGHGIIGAVTVALELGLLEGVEPITKVTLDTPAGLVFATAQLEGEVVRSVTVENVPSFLYCEGVKVNIPRAGSIPVSVAFGGNFFALVASVDVGLEILPENAGKLVEIGMQILNQVNKQVEVIHPTKRHFRSINLVEFHEPARGQNADGRNVVIFGSGSFDRSPCGTGTCARMAALFAKGRLALGQSFVHESIIGTTFTGRLIRKTMIGDVQAVIPEISGQAFITGIQQFVINPDDPLKYGFIVGSPYNVNKGKGL